MAGDEASHAIELDVRFERDGEGVFTAVVRSHGRKVGERKLHDRSATCDALSEAVSVSIALLLDGAAHDDSAESRADSEPSPLASAAAPPVDASPTTRNAVPSEPTGEPFRARVGLAVGGGYGLGGSALLGGGQLGVALSGLRLELGGLASLPSSAAYHAGEVKTSLLLGHLRACYLLGRSFAVGPCAVFGVGRLRGEGRGFDQAFRSDLLWTAAGLGLTAESRLTRRLYGAVGATLWVPLRRQTFSVEYAGIAWESRPVAGVLTATLGFELL